MAVIWLTTGLPGSGKSYSRVLWLCTDYLVNSTGKYITNLPLNIDRISNFVASRTGKSPDVYKDRIVLIPDNVFSTWQGLDTVSSDVAKTWDSDPLSFPPRQYFNQFDLSNAHIAIDEFHLVLARGFKPKLRQAWSAWFAEIRKEGCTFEGITQDLDLIAKEFLGKVALRTDLIPASELRDPIFRISQGDWYELRAAYTGVVEQTIVQYEYSKKTSLTGGLRWHLTNSKRFVICSEYYDLYDSYRRNDTSGGGGSGHSDTPSQIWGKRTIFWFLRRNWFNIAWRLCLGVFLFWVCFCGGAGYFFEGFISSASLAASGGASSRSGGPARSVSRSVVGQGGGSDVPVSPPPPPPSPPPAPLVPVLFFNNFVYLQTGEKVNEGYVFASGDYKGKKVVKVDFPARSIVLDSGDVFFMRL